LQLYSGVFIINVLLLSDDLQDESLLAHALRLAGLRVIIDHDLKLALARWTERSADLIVVALRLPDPLAAVEEVRRMAIVPLIIIADPMREDLHIRLVESGADWVIERPYDLRHFIVYSQAIIRRTGNLRTASLPVLQYQTIELDPGKRTVRTQNTSPKRLSQLEFRLLHTLMAHKGQVLPTETIVEHVWGYNGDGDRSLVRGLIKRLRVKVEENPNAPHYIRTVARIGYIFGEDDV